MAMVGRDALRRRTPDRITWIVAFGLFGIAAAAEVIGDTSGWNAPLVRIYYLTGAVLVVGFLALGQLYLLAAHRIRRFAPGVALLLTAVSASTVWGAPIDRARMTEDGWDAITRTTGLTVLAVSINTIGTLILLGGLVYAAVRFKQSGMQRNRMIGCLLIAVGTLTVAMGGTLTRFGSEQYLYIAMSLGVALIFGGYVWTKRPESREAGEEASKRGIGQEGAEARRREVHAAGLPAPQLDPSAVSLGEVSLPQPGVSIPGSVPIPPASLSLNPQPSTLNPAIAFIEAWLQSKSDDELSEECRVWSVPAQEIDAFSRVDARRVWAFRARLSAAAQQAFDARPVALRLQMTELYLDVLAPEISLVDRPVIASLDRLAGREHADPSPTRVAAGSVD